MSILDAPGVTQAQLLVAVPTSTLRNIATRCRTCNQNSASFTQMNSRTLHINRGSSVNFVQLVFPNWYASTTSENSFGTTATITAAIEYPAGVFTQVKFSGAAQGTIANGANIVSDKCFIGIPKHATFWVRSYFVNSAGIFVSPQNVSATGGNAGEYCMAVASGGVDYTMTAGATNSPPYTASAYYPLAILGMSSVPSVCCFGDSRLSGQGDDASTDTGMFNVGELGRSLGRSLPYTLVATPGDKLSDFITRYAKRGALAAYHTHVHWNYGINDLSSGQSAATVQANCQTMYAAFSAYKQSQGTLTVQTSNNNADGWTSQAGQSQVTSSQPRLTFNTWVRTKPSPLWAYFDIAIATQYPADQLRWNFPGYTADGTHETPLGYAAIANAGVIDTSLFV
jgi:hypothetical protein